MIEKIEITQRFNFKKLNRHYECFIIDFINKNAYYKINERFAHEKFIEKSWSCDNTWADIFTDLKSHVSSKIYHFEDNVISGFMEEFDNLNLFDNFKSPDFSYFEKLESVYSCNINFYFSDDYRQYCIKNDFPDNWIKFSELLTDLVDFDVLNIEHLKKLAVGLFYEIRKDAIYDKSTGDKLQLTSLEFGHYESFPKDTPHPGVIADLKNGEVKGYIERQFSRNWLLKILEKYGVYLWIYSSYQNKSLKHDSQVLDGYEWYLELVFNDSVIWTILAHNEYPDTYLCLALEIYDVTGYDLLESNTFSDEDTALFKNYGKSKLK